MNTISIRPDPGRTNRTIPMAAAVLFACLSVAGCGSGSTTQSIPVVSGCDTAGAADTDQCGTVLIGITDADGDFLDYTVDVVSLTLESAGGTTVETLSRRTRINFSDYVDLTELMTAATVPPGTYVGGVITLDYSDAGIVVETGGESKPATVIDADGNPVQKITQKIMLSNRDRLVITRGSASLLTLDFDLEASHAVDITPTPALATVEPFFLAEVGPVDAREIRVRGLLIEGNESGMYYTVALRPFYDRVGDFGHARVNVTPQTEFSVNESPYTGVDGLRALAAAGRGTPTVAQGTLDVAERAFTAAVVLAGSSVPGTDRDAVRGNVIARRGDDLLVRGATILRPDRDAYFHDDVTVTLGPDTKVFKTGYPQADLDAGAISVGQRITVRGDVIDSDAARLHVDATRGAVRMDPTHLAGLVNTVVPGQTDIELHTIDRRRVRIFDFTGTGRSPDEDADPDNYEVATGNLFVNPLATGRPVVVYGFPAAFGAAPPDFDGRTIIDFAGVRSVLGVGWGSAGTRVPFLAIGSDGLVLDNQNRDIDLRHHIKQGPVLIDLTRLDSGTVIAPRQTGRCLFAIKTSDSLQLFSDFDDFIDALTLALDGATAARSLYARGQYDAGRNVFTACRIGIHLLEP